MARTVFSGTAGQVKLATYTNGVADSMETIAELRAWSLEESSTTIEFTRIGAGSITGHKPGYKTWTATADLYLPADDTTGDEMITETASGIAIATNTEYAWEFYIDDELAGKYSGDGIVTGVSRSLSHDGMVEMSVTIQGTSDLT